MNNNCYRYVLVLYLLYEIYLKKIFIFFKNLCFILWKQKLKNIYFAR